MVHGPDDVFAARPPRGRRPAGVLAPLLGAGLGLGLSLGGLALLAAAARPAGASVAVAVALLGAAAGGWTLWRLDRRGATRERRCPPT